MRILNFFKSKSPADVVFKSEAAYTAGKPANNEAPGGFSSATWMKAVTASVLARASASAATQN